MQSKWNHRCCAAILTAMAGAVMLIGAGCASEPNAPIATVAHHLGEYPEIDFAERPSYLPTNVISLTFDDGPDWNNTAKVLDVLAAHNAKASFYINTHNWSDLDADAPMQDLVRRMVAEGHELANHTATHSHLPMMTAGQIEQEIAGVETTVQSILGADAPRLTLLRAPFGEPYQDGNGYDLVAPVVAAHAVHMGWAIDTYDYDCPVGDSACVVNNFTTALAAGSYGVVLLHSVHSQTADALPAILQYIDDNGYELWSSEQVVCARYGTSSAHLVDGTTGGCEPDVDPTDGPDAGPTGPDTRPDAGVGGGGDVDAGGGDNGGDGDDDSDGTSGGGCAVGHRGGPAGAAWLLAAAVLLARRRRRYGATRQAR